MSFVLAIDGPAGGGKGTIAKAMSEKMNLVNIDTGAMYRCIALRILRENVKLDELDRIQEILDTTNIELKNENGEPKVFLNGEDVSKLIRTEEVSAMASSSSTLQIIREKLVELQRKCADGKNVVMEGRDIGTKVFPNADVKIFLTATPEERARRRQKQLQEKGQDVDYETVLNDIKERDHRDSTRAIDPLRQAEDAVLLDTTDLSIPEVVARVEEIVKEKMN